MVDTTMAADVGATERSGHRRWRWLAAGIVVLAVIAVPSIAWWYGHSAETFDVPGVSLASVNVTTAGTAYSVGVTSGTLPAVTVTKSHVILGKGSGPAAVGAVVCELSSVGITGGPLTPYATGCRDLTDVDLGGLPDTAQIIVTVVPLANQAVNVTGLSVEFQDGWRQGSRTVPVNFTLAAPA